MRKTIATLAVALLAVGMLAVPAIADHGETGLDALFPAQNRQACEAHDGVYSEPDAHTNVCVVTGDERTRTDTLREAGRSGRSWESTVTYVEETTYTRTVIQGPGGPEFDDDVDTQIITISCTNPGGQLMQPGTGACPA
jgi:hypothetical protein